jgi:hypothetical protein
MPGHGVRHGRTIESCSGSVQLSLRDKRPNDARRPSEKSLGEDRVSLRDKGKLRPIDGSGSRNENDGSIQLPIPISYNAGKY